MTENKLQLIARTLGGWILASKGAEKGILAEVLALVTEVMGRGQEIPADKDPVYWFDPLGRFCTRAQTKREIEDSMMLMAIAEGIFMDDIRQDDPEWEGRMKAWDAFQEMKCRYLEGLMRIKELEEALQEVKLRQPLPTKERRFADIDHLKQFLLMAMDMSGVDTLTKGDLILCLDKAPSWEIDIHTKTAEKEKKV